MVAPAQPHEKLRDTVWNRLARAACATAALACAVSCQSGPAVSSPPAYFEDFDSAWSFIRDHYAYFDEKSVDWVRVREVLRPQVANVRDRHQFIGLLETLVEHLYDHHAHLGVNTASSPRLIPSGADLWAVHRNGTAVITQVRAGSDAERAGLRAAMEIVSIGGRPVRDAVEDRLPEALDREDAAAQDWALRTLLAGRQKAAVNVGIHADGAPFVAEFQPGLTPRPESALTARIMDQGIGHVRVHNTLGDSALVQAWDAALDTLRESRGLILDLRDTPSGGDTIVARPILGRLVAEARPYQRHELPREERVWVQEVTPRGPFTYDKPIAVLVGRWTGSMGEGVAIGLDGMRRATVFGSPMAGLRGATLGHALEHTGIPVRVPAERLYHVDGTPREAFVPPFLVEPHTPGADPVFEAALQWLRKQP